MTKEVKTLTARVNELEKTVTELTDKLESLTLSKHSYTVTETAMVLGVTRQAVYAMIDRGELETVKLGVQRILGSSLRAKLGN